MRAFLKKLASKRCYVPAGARVIFISHDISSHGQPTFSAANSTSPALFLRQLNFLKCRFRFVTLDEIQSSASPEALASLSFDDGFLTVATVAMPILRELGIPASVFCNGLAVKESRLEYGDEYPALPYASTRFYMNADEIKALRSEGTIIGSHGFSHRSMAAMGEAELQKEIFFNKELLEGITGAKISDFAFPFGKSRHISEAAISACLRAGHSRLYSANPRYACPPAKEGELIPRVSLHLQDESGLTLQLNRLFFSRAWPAL